MVIKTNFVYISFSIQQICYRLVSSLKHILAIKTNLVYIFHLQTTKMPLFKNFVRASRQSRPILFTFSISTPQNCHRLKSSLEHLLVIKTDFVYIFHLHITDRPSFKNFLIALLGSQDQFRLYFPSPRRNYAIV